MRVLLAVDGSEPSYEAVSALRYFSPLEEVHLLHVVDLPGMRYQSWWFKMKDLATMVEQNLREAGEGFLDRAASLLPDDVGPVFRHIVDGKPTEKILAIAEISKIDLVVLGSRGLNRVSEKVFGSVSHGVMLHAPCSTLIVKSPLHRIHRILLPIQGSGDAHVALSLLRQKPFCDPVQVGVLHVVPFSHPLWLEGALVSESYRLELMMAAKHLTNNVTSLVSSLGYEAIPVTTVGPPTKGIIEEAEATKADLVLMSAGGRTAVSRVFLGSVSHGVIHQVPGAVLCVR